MIPHAKTGKCLLEWMAALTMHGPGVRIGKVILEKDVMERRLRNDRQKRSAMADVF